MTLEEISLVQNTWAKVVPIKETAAELFYGKLFELDPALQPLFKGDIKEQGRKLMAMIDVAVNGLTQLGQLVPAVQALGRRHAGYGVKDAHYGTVATALLWTLEKGLGPAFTPEVRGVWVKTYSTLSTVMQKAAATATSFGTVRQLDNV
jgi:hemoglobin-like flavoprotein